MLKTRVMPCLLLRRGGLVKTVQFKNPQYVGDPINTVRIYNDKEVDELIFLDITATPDQHEPQFDLLEEIATECFMPFSYGGGVRTLEGMKTLFGLGVEKVAVNTCAHENPALIREASAQFGAQSLIGSMDVKKNFFGKYEVRTVGGAKRTGLDPVAYARSLEALGVGEILLTSIDRDGTFEGYDIHLIRKLTEVLSIPLIACGGAGTLEDFGLAVHEGKASAVATGSMVVYQGANRAVLINFPSKKELKNALGV